MDSDEEINVSKRKTGNKNFLDSDESEEESGNTEKKVENSVQKEESENDDESNSLPPISAHSSSKRIKNFNQLIDSDDEESNQATGHEKLADNSVISSHKDPTDSEDNSDDNNDDTEKEKIENKFESPKPTRMKFSDLVDSDSESNSGNSAENDEEEGLPPKKEIKKLKKKKKEVSKTQKSISDGERHSDSGNNLSDGEVDTANILTSKREKKMSHKQAEDQMKQIISESQRMAREKTLSVPYHKPKQYTLKEFLSRRTVNKPSVAIAEPAKKTINAIRMNDEDLAEYVNRIKEREKEAIEFFKSESESESEKEDEKEKPVEDPNTKLEVESAQPESIEEKIIEPVTENLIAPEPEVIPEISDEKGLVEQTELMETETSEIPPETTKSDEVPLETEIIEEPKTKIDTESEQVENPQTSALEPEPTEVATKTEEEILKEKEEADLERLRQKYGSDAVPVPSIKSGIPIEYDLDLDDIKDVPKKQLKRPELKFFGAPKLSTEKDLIIDLESGEVLPRKLTGPEKLFENFMKNVAKPKHKTSTCMSVLIADAGKLEVEKIIVKYDEEEEVDNQKPGFAHEKLKETLREKIMQKRREEINRKLKEQEILKKEDEEEEMEELSDCGMDDKDDAEDGELGEEEEDEDEDEEMEIDENEEVVTVKKAKKKEKETNEFLDNEAEVEDDDDAGADEDEDDDDDEDEEDESSSSESEQEVEENENKPNKKGRIIKAFEDSDDEAEKAKTIDSDTPAIPVISSEPLLESSEKLKSNEGTQEEVAVESGKDLLETPATQETQDDKCDGILKYSEDDIFKTQSEPFSFSEPSISEQKMSTIDDLFDPNTQCRNLMDDLMDVCSGRFAATQKAPDARPLYTQGPTQNPDDLFELCSGQFVTQNEIATQAKEVESKEPDISEPEKDIVDGSEIANNEATEKPLPKNINELLASSEDEENKENEDSKKRTKKLKKKKSKKKRIRLGFSDDEDESNVAADQIDQEEDLEEAEDEEEEEEVFVDYDSEENEIEVKLTKEERVKAATAYFEKEAELSESEWGSADEDEKDMDRVDIELGDEDEFDQEQLQNEVGRIHMRQILDDDAKAVKKLQDQLFEDEENDGVGRERKFRWKNQAEGFVMDDENARDFDGDHQNEEAEEESETMWRRMRHERDLIVEKTMKEETTQNTTEILLMDHCSQTVTSSNTISLSKKKINIVRSTSSTIEKEVKESTFLIAKTVKSHNSFLSTRGSFLSRDDDTLEKIAGLTKGADNENVGSIVTGKGNFVFSAISPAVNKSETNPNKRKSDSVLTETDNKKQKRDPPSKKKLMLLDQLVV